MAGGADWEINVKPYEERKLLPPPDNNGYYEAEPRDPGKLF